MRCQVDLHCHTSASFDQIEGALRLRDVAPPELAIIVGEEIRSTRGDVIGLYLERPIAGGLSLEATIEAIRVQGGVVGVPHPFDAHRPAVAVDMDQPATQERLASLIDYVEVYNGRVRECLTERAQEFAQRFGIAGVAASDAHSDAEVG